MKLTVALMLWCLMIVSFQNITTIATPLPQDKNTLSELSVPFKYYPAKNIELTGYLGKRVERNFRKQIIGADKNELIGCFKRVTGTQTYAGEHLGKFFDAASCYLKYKKDEVFTSMLSRYFEEWIGCQMDDGYLGTYDNNMRWKNWDLWVQKYDLVGLLAYYKTTHNQKSMLAACKIGDLICSVFGDEPGKLTINYFNKTGVQTSVLEPMADLYLYTGNERYLNFCNYIIRSYTEPDGINLVEGFKSGKDANLIANGKAYEQLSNLTGLLKLYQLTKNNDYLDACLKAWKSIRTSFLFITGSCSTHERYHATGHLEAEFEDQPGEGCVTFSWIQFNQQLFAITGNQIYFDEIEKTIYNHLLSAQNPSSGAICYYTALNGYKPYSQHITCCRSSISRGISRIPSLTAGILNDTLSVLLYESFKGEVEIPVGKTREKIEIECNSEFPSGGKTSFQIKVPGADTFPLNLRVPVWCKNFQAKVNGQVLRGTAGSFLTLNRKWKKTTIVEVNFEIPFEIIPDIPSYPGKFAFKRGPQILSSDASLSEEIVLALTDSKIDNYSFATYPLPQNFTIDQGYKVTGKGIESNLVLIPFADAGQNGGRVETILGSSDSNAIDLSNLWRIMANDNPEYKKQAFDDRTWELLPALVKSWDKLGYHAFDGIGWYRKQFHIPLSWKEMLTSDKKLQLDLGLITHACEVFLNGKLVGSNGSFPPNYVSASKVPVKFEIPVDMLNWGEANTIAVRIYNHEYMGGMMCGPYKLQIVSK